jgi:hypothetical protein
MDRIEAVELLNMHFFTDTTQCREAWYTIRTALVELGAAPNSARDAIVALEKRVATLERLCAASRLSLNVPLGGAPMAP